MSGRIPAAYAQQGDFDWIVLPQHCEPHEEDSLGSSSVVAGFKVFFINNVKYVIYERYMLRATLLPIVILWSSWRHVYFVTRR